MLERVKRAPLKATQLMYGLLGMSFLTVEGELMITHVLPDGKGGWVKAKHPNRLKALLGFHDVRLEHKVITDAFVADVVDALQGTTTPYNNFKNYKYHDSGTGTGNEAVGDTGLGTPCGEARDVGTQIEGVTGNIYKSVATHTYAGAFAITEHGLFNASTVGTLMDRTKFSAVNVGVGEGIQFTYQITLTSGG